MIEGERERTQTVYESAIKAQTTYLKMLHTSLYKHTTVSLKSTPYMSHSNLLVWFIYLWTAEKIVMFSSVLKSDTPCKITSMLKGWKIRVDWNSISRWGIKRLHLKKKCSASSITLQEVQYGDWLKWLLKRSMFKLLQLLRIQACRTDRYLLP